LGRGSFGEEPGTARCVEADGVRLERAAGWSGPGTLVLVTHGLTVQSLVGILPGQAETVVLRSKPGKEPGVEVVGRIPGPE